MTVSEVFGRMIDGAAVQTAALRTLQTWLPDYLREVERQADIPQGRLPAPRSWGIAAGDVEKWFAQAPPAVLVRSDGAPRTTRGAQAYGAEWELDVVVTVSASVQRRDAPLILAQRYGAAVRAALVQHGTLDGFAVGVDWTETNTADAMERRKVRAVVVESFIVHVADVVARFGGPIEPARGRPSPESPEWPTPERVEIEIQREELSP